MKDAVVQVDAGPFIVPEVPRLHVLAILHPGDSLCLGEFARLVLPFEQRAPGVRGQQVITDGPQHDVHRVEVALPARPDSSERKNPLHAPVVC